LGRFRVDVAVATWAERFRIVPFVIHTRDRLDF
jgi:hypothetical protein